MSRPIYVLTEGDIGEVLPHRGRCRMVDTAEVFFGNENQPPWITGMYFVPRDPWWQYGHFPGNPMMRGGDMVDLLAQILGLLIRFAYPDLRGKKAMLCGVEEVKVRGIVRPGARLRLEAGAGDLRRRLGVITGSAKAFLLPGDGQATEEKLVCEGTIILAVSDELPA